MLVILCPPPPRECSLGLCLCPGSLASVACIPWGSYHLCSSNGKPGKGWGMGREMAEYFFPFSPAGPAQGPHLWPQPPGSAVAFAPWSLQACQGQGGVGGYKCFLGPPRSWLAPFHFFIPWTLTLNWSLSFARTLKRHQGMETIG